MSTNSTLPPLPNPFTPLAFLPPTLAEQFQASIYIYIAGLSAFIWDWLMSIPDEIQMCRKSKLSPAMVTYFLSRIGTLAYCSLALVFQAASVPHCNAVLYAIGGCFVVAVPSSSALFFFRVKAVYANNKIVTYFFGFLLFALFGLSFLIPLAIKGAHIGTTQRCINTLVASYASTPLVLNSVIDTLVFIAISFRIMSYSIVGDTFGARMKSFLRGDGLPSVSRGLLQGGQLYYFATIGLNIVVAAMVLAPVPPVYHAMFSIPNLALESAMACRVFRRVKLGLIVDADGAAQRSTALRSANRSQPASANHHKMRTLDDSRMTLPVTVEITKEFTESDSFPSDGRDPDLYNGGHSRRWDDKNVAFNRV